MATGRPPFMHKNHHQLGLLIRNGNIIFPDPVRHKILMSDNLKDLISKLLDRKASTRLGSNGDVNEVVSHPFFSDIDFDKLQRKEIKPPYMPSAEQMTLKEAEITEMKNDKS
jgi:serum/glucocorticoid-regulated kinase 2